MVDSGPVLVTGATGQQGGAVARALLGRGHRVRALVRNAEGERARELAVLGAELVGGHFDDPDALVAAAEGASAMFAVATPFTDGVDAEVRHGIALADAAVATGVDHLVYSSVGSADRGTAIPHFDSKAAVERHIAGLNIPATIVGPVAFMAMWTAPFITTGLADGTLAMPLPANVPLQYVAVEDIGLFVALVMERPAEFAGRRVDIASDELTGAQLASLLREATGRTIRYEEQPLEPLRATNADMAAMFSFFAREGYRADIEGLRRDYPEVGWHRAHEWIAEQDWVALLDGSRTAQ